MSQKKYRLFRVCCILLVFIVLGSVIFIALNSKDGNSINENNKTSFKAVENTYTGSKTEYIKVAETDSIVMMANLYNGDFYITNKKTNTNWYSIPQNINDDEITTGSKRDSLHSQLFFEYIYKEDEISAVSMELANSNSDSLLENAVVTKVVKDGIQVTYNFNLLEISIPVFYTIENDYLEAKVDLENLVENDDIYLMSIGLLPSFGANYNSDKGYLFIPDGSGAIVNFDNGINSDKYEKMIYGADLAISEKNKKTQDESVRLPVYGIKKENDSLLGIVVNGDKSTAICAYNKNESCAYDAVFSKRIFRTLTSKTIYEKDAANRQNIGRVTQADDLDGYKIRFYFLSDTDSDYVGMAKKYQEYLFQYDNLDRKNNKPAFNIEVAGAYDTYASFLGIPYTKVKSLTTYKELEEISEALKNKGIDNINIRYNGWSNDGVLNINRVKDVKPLSVLGGKKELNNLLSYTGNNNFDLYLDIDLLQFRKGSASDTVRDPFERITKKYHYLRSVYTHDTKTDEIRLLSMNSLLDNYDRISNSIDNIEVNNISLSNLGDYLYSNYSENNYVSRTESANQIVELLQKFNKKDYKVSIDGGNAFTLPYINRVNNVPIASSNYDIFNDSIPFYQIVLHGKVTMSGETILQSSEPINSYLKAVETGIELSYSCIYESSDVLIGTRYDSLYSSTYTHWLDNATNQHLKYYDLQKRICDKSIIEHGKISDNVYFSVFENGLKVIVNYSNTDIEYNGAVIPKKDFCIIDKEQ